MTVARVCIPRRRSWAGRSSGAGLLLLAALAAPAHAQVPTDRPVVARGAPGPGLDAFAGRRVAAVDIAGHNVTKDWVITREIFTKVGEPLDLTRLEEDVSRLENIAIFSDIRVEAAEKDGGVALTLAY